MQLLSLLPLLATIADARHIPLRRYRQDQPNKQHHQHARAMDVLLDERGLPITATTTVVVDMTSTMTVWVPPTGQVPLQPQPSVSESISETEASASETPSSSASESASALPTTTASSIAGDSPSASASEWDSASEATASPSEWLSSVIASPSASSGWASSAIASESASSASVSETASPSASYSSLSENTYSSSYPASSSATYSESASEASPSSNGTASASEPSLSASTSASASASNATPSISSSESLSEASFPSSSISTQSESASGSTSSARWTRSSASGPPRSSYSASATASASDSASVSDWEASASSSAASSSWSSSAGPSASASSSSSYNETSTSASSSSDAASSSSSILPSSTSASASSASPSPSSGTNLPGVPRTLMAGYYPDWSAYSLPPESVDWNRFDVVDFAFAIPTWDGRLEFTQWDSSDLLNRLVTGAHSNGKRVKLSIGGWTGSKYFSSLLGDWNQRQNFVSNCVKAYWAYNLDGIDIDWEYPNAGGAQGNIISSSDSANYLLFLQELRAALPEGALITLATQVWPFAGSNGRPLGDVSGFAEVIDWILIMNYDIWGSSDNPGPNAPLSDACGTSTQPLANAYASVASWTSAGMPAEKITLGVPAYGYLQKSWATSLRTRDYIPPSADEIANFTSQLAPLEKRQSGIVTVRNGGGGDDNGQIGFADLVRQGALALDSQGKYIGAGGFYREWDRCSSTPWIRSSSSGQVVTYDDPDSLSMKAQFARQSGLRGVNVFSMDGDWTGSSWPLTDALRSGMGI